MAWLLLCPPSWSPAGGDTPRSWKLVDNKIIHLFPPRCSGVSVGNWAGWRAFWGEKGPLWSWGGLAGEEELEGMRCPGEPGMWEP